MRAKLSLLAGAISACGVLLMSCLPASAQRFPEITNLRVQLEDLNTSLSQLGNNQRPVDVLLRAHGFIATQVNADSSSSGTESFRPREITPNVVAERIDARLVLSFLNQSFGARDSFVVENVQGSVVPHAMLIRGGEFTLSDLPDLFEQAGYGDEGFSENGVVQVPLVVWSDAHLDIRPGEMVMFSRETGAYLINFGRLTMDGATILATEEESPYNAEFRPFVTIAGQGSLYAMNSHFGNLGFGETPKFMGLSILGSAAGIQSERSILIGNLFEEIRGVSIIAMRAMEIRENKFDSSRSNALQVSESPDAQIIGNLFFGPSPTNAIRLQRGSDRSRLIGNYVLGGSRAGIVVERGISDVQLIDNVVWARTGSGIKLRNADCALVRDNIILDNEQKGVEVRASNGVEVTGNLISYSRSAGIWVAEQNDGARVYFYNNVLSENGSGISGATAEQIVLSGNDMSGQYPRILDGDLTHQFRALVEDARGDEQIILTSAGLIDETSDGPSEICSGIGGVR